MLLWFALVFSFDFVVPFETPDEAGVVVDFLLCVAGIFSTVDDDFFPVNSSCLAAGLSVVLPPLLLQARVLLGVDGFVLDIFEGNCTTGGACCLPLGCVLLAGKSALVLAAIFLSDGEHSSVFPLLLHASVGVLHFWRYSFKGDCAPSSVSIFFFDCVLRAGD